MLHTPAIKWFLKVCIYLSALFAMWLFGGNNWYLMFLVVIFNFKAVDSLLSIKWKPGWIHQLFISSVKDVKSLIISLSLIFFLDLVIMALKLYTYITKMYLFHLLEVLWKRPHRSL